MLGIGILGCGRIGQVHARSLSRLRGARLVSVADALPDAAAALATEYGAEAQSAEALITSSDVEAVVIGTPTTTHYDLIHAAAAAGKAIFCEKPIDLDAARVATCIDSVAAAGVPFMTAFQRRFDPHFKAVADRLHGGEIGETELVILTSRDPGPPPIGYIKTSGGLFRDMMIHDLDMARFLLAEEPVEVFAAGACFVDPGIAEAGDIDTAAVTLKTASGRICQINNSRRATYGYDQRIEVHGSKGMLRASNVLENLVERAGASGFEAAPTQNFFLERYEAAYLAEMAYFVEAVSAGTAPQPSAEDGRRAQLLADAATASYTSGVPVKLD
ncbi:MAG: inositol 2-dehydrogenase [Pseudomonadota bacterium]